MNKTKWLVLIIIVAAVAGMIGFRMSHTRNPEPVPGSVISTEEHSSEPKEIEQTTETVTLTMDEWTNHVLTALDCAGEDGEVTIDGEQMTVSGELPKTTIETWLNEGNVELSGMYNTIFSALPDSLPMTLTCAVTCENGKVMLEENRIEAAGIELPTDIIADSVWDGINESLNDQLSRQIDSISAIRFEGQSVLLEP